MQHLDRLIRQHPRLRDVDFQLLVREAQLDPASHWKVLVEASAPIAYSMALRLAAHQQNAPAVAEHACFELFQALRDNDYARLRGVVGFARWSTLLLRWLRETPSLAALTPPATADADRPIPVADERVRAALAKEGPRLTQHMDRVLRALHRRDRLLLAMRYEQQLTLRQLDRLFRLGTPQRVASLLDRLTASLQPIQAVADQASLDATQREALLAELVRQVFQRDMQSDEHRSSAHALQHR